MRNELKIFVKNSFERLLLDHDVNYVMIKKAGFKLRTFFKKEVSPSLQTYVVLHWHSYDDKFQIDLGWTYNSSLDDIHSCFDAATAIREDAVILNVHSISGTYDWWSLEGVGNRIMSRSSQVSHGSPAWMANAEIVIRNAFAVFLDLGVPYLDQVIVAKETEGRDHKN